MSEKTEPVEFTAAEQAMLILAGGIADEREENRKLRTEIAALTSERDEAVRVATELRAKAALADEAVEPIRILAIMGPSKATDWLAHYDALAHGGTKPQEEPMNQKEQGR